MKHYWTLYEKFDYGNSNKVMFWFVCIGYMAGGLCGAVDTLYGTIQEAGTKKTAVTRFIILFVMVYLWCFSCKKAKSRPKKSEIILDIYCPVVYHTLVQLTLWRFHHEC